MVLIVFLWFGISAPLSAVGAYFGSKHGVRQISILHHLLSSYWIYYDHNQGCTSSCTREPDSPTDPSSPEISHSLGNKHYLYATVHRYSLISFTWCRYPLYLVESFRLVKTTVLLSSFFLLTRGNHRCCICRIILRSFKSFCLSCILRFRVFSSDCRSCRTYDSDCHYSVHILHSLCRGI